MLQQEASFNYSRIKLKEDGRAQYHVNYEGEQITLTAEQAVAALFTEVTDILALNSIENKEAVISVPAYFNQVQRQALVDAAKVAGIEVVKLYNESSATVMNYGIFRKADLSASTPRTVAFVDFGHTKTSVYIANIWNDRAEILFEETDPNAGVRNIDLALMSFYLDKFNAKHKVDLSDNPKALYRLMEAIEKQRKILTANTEAALSIECLFVFPL
jgi:molecular chaperone DnaK (HSP70)